MTELEQAAERLRTNKYDDAEYLDGVFDSLEQIRDSRRIAEDAARFYDPRPVDEAFARRVAVEIDESGGTKQCWIDRSFNHFLFVFATSAVSLHIGGGCHIASPTIGQFWMACRLFRVEVKEQT